MVSICILQTLMHSLMTEIDLVVGNIQKKKRGSIFLCWYWSLQTTYMSKYYTNSYWRWGCIENYFLTVRNIPRIFLKLGIYLFRNNYSIFCREIYVWSEKLWFEFVCRVVPTVFRKIKLTWVISEGNIDVREYSWRQLVYVTWCAFDQSHPRISR